MRIRSFSILLVAAALASAQSTPIIAPGGIANGASFQAMPLAPGSLFSIFGSGLASQIANASTVPLSNSLGGVTVQFVNGSTTVDAPIKYVQPGTGTTSLVNAQIPWDLVPAGTSATVNMIVSNNGVPSASTQVQIAPFSPGIFAYNTAAGIFAYAYTYNDATFAWPTNSVPGLTTHPAVPNTLIVIYATGLGAVTPDSPADGADSLDKTRTAATTPMLLIGGISVPIAFAGLSAQYPGVYQINVVLPSNVPTGNAVPVQLQVGGITTPNTFTMAISSN
jgi:uncharacterized protein (TIGR03437 family)